MIVGVHGHLESMFVSHFHSKNAFWNNWLMKNVWLKNKKFFCFACNIILLENVWLKRRERKMYLGKNGYQTRGECSNTAFLSLQFWYTLHVRSGQMQMLIVLKICFQVQKLWCWHFQLLIKIKDLFSWLTSNSCSVSKAKSLANLSKSCDDTFNKLVQSGVSPDELYDAVCKQVFVTISFMFTN